MSKIAVLLAAYNGEKWIEQQIRTIFIQKNINLHLYISLDLSTDNTYDLIRKISENNDNIKLLSYGKRFGNAARNFYRIIEEVPVEEYDYIALSDQDDIWLENKLSNAISLLDKYNADGYSSNVMAFWENGKTEIIKKSYPAKEFDYLFQTPGPGCTFVLKQHLIKNLKCLILEKKTLVSELDIHDWFIYAYARSNNYKWIIDKNSYIKYRQHSANLVGANIGFYAFMKRIKLMLSGYGFAQLIKIIKVLDLENISFIQKWYKYRKINFLTLALYSCKCRRRTREQIYFFVLCILLFLSGYKIKSDHQPENCFDIEEVL
jgi:rhamnosyltransferase